MSDPKIDSGQKIYA